MSLKETVSVTHIIRTMLVCQGTKSPLQYRKPNYTLCMQL